VGSGWDLNYNFSDGFIKQHNTVKPKAQYR